MLTFSLYKKIEIFTIIFLTISICVKAQNLPVITPKPVIDDYFGIKIEDPYRNIENLEDPEVKAWMKAHSEYARKTLNNIPGRQGLIDKMKEFDSRRAARISDVKVLKNDMYFYLKIRPEDQQAKLYYRNGYKGEETLLFDPETVAKGKVYTISKFSASEDGSKVNLVIAEKGAELGELLVIDVKSKKLFPDRIKNSFDLGFWMPDGNSFTYTPYNSNNIQSMESVTYTQAKLHTLGTSVSGDKVIFSSKINPEMGIKGEELPMVVYDKDSKLIFGILYTDDRSLKMYYAPIAELTKPKINWKPLFTTDMEVTNFKSNAKYIYFTTSKNTSRQKLMRTLLSNIDAKSAETVVEESPNESINDKSLVITKDGVYFSRTKNGVEAFLYMVSENKELVAISLPKPAGALNLLEKDVSESELWVSIAGWSTPSTRYLYDIKSKIFTQQPLSKVPKYPEYYDLIVEELMIPSHDGVMVPLSVMYKKGTLKNGTAPLLLDGYGAYSVLLDPVFSAGYLLWTLNNGILATAHVRGGGELGEAWHKAGQKTTKPNTWKDLIASAEYLIKNKYTSSQHLAINGGSAGGILIGRAMTERPDLFAAAIPEVGCMNALRFENSPNGPVNTPEFGTVKIEQECKALIEMDAYLHLKKDDKYPATLITAGFNDPRIIAWQPAKFAARLLVVNKSDKPILFFTDYEAGHGIGNAKQKQWEQFADLFSFGLWQTGAPGFQVIKK